ncbi:MAG: HAD-IB family hydrolase, partial [Bacteroidota bacterium]
KTIDVNPDEIKELAKLMRRYPVAYVMTHKTYIDMMVLQIVLNQHGMPTPHIFAGINMSFMGLGELGRNTGLIFIRRSFKDNQVYKMTLRHFIATLVNEQQHFMWAIEGTRSRTGKLVWPKMGILKYIMDAEQDSTRDVKYVPVSIVYDLIPDVKDMTREGRGKDKKPETLLWFVNYLRKMGDKLGKISIRFGAPVEIDAKKIAAIPISQKNVPEGVSKISRQAFELVHRINQITPVTTASLICTTLLSKYALSKRSIEVNISDLMLLIESHKPDALVDRGKPIGESVQVGLNLLQKAGLVKQVGEGLNAKYAIVTENYLEANYYANMASHHLYRRAFIELALLHLMESKPENRIVDFWTEVMDLRNLFKFEFFYPERSKFSDEVEKDMNILLEGLQDQLRDEKFDIDELLHEQELLVAPAILFTYIEAYRIVAQALQAYSPETKFDEHNFLEMCIALGEEMQWQGQIHRVESVSKPFLLNGIRLVVNSDLIPNKKDAKKDRIDAFLKKLQVLAERNKVLQSITLARKTAIVPTNGQPAASIPIERNIVPGSRIEQVTSEILAGESGSHIGAFFDLDRTLINGFSAKEFFQTRLLSGKMSAKEIIAQFAGVLVYATGNGNFAGLAAIGAKGVQGTDEKVFIQLGEEVYHKHLAKAIYPESRELVEAHVAKGHTVAIVSAATPYQVDPIAADLGIEHVMCTRMEVQNGKFTGKILEPACWGGGKAIAGRQLAAQHQLDLNKSYFYTDSASDLPLLDIVGHPRPINPDTNLSAIAFENDWPILRLDENERPGISGVVRTGLAAGSLVPAVISGVSKGTISLSWKEGINGMMAAMGDIGTSVAGIKLVVKNEHNLWAHRPAVFIFNHQSSADLFIGAKLLRKDARAIAKKELKFSPIGPLMMAAGVIFVDRANREKAIEAMKPAVDALKSGTSIVIAPEGTRSYDYKLGKFKKGAFHLAMQAGVPIVPIVIKNAHDVLPRGQSLIRSSAVEVVVLDPISVKDWKKENLNEHISGVRQLYLNELGQTD